MCNRTWADARWDTASTEMNLGPSTKAVASSLYLQGGRCANDRGPAAHIRNGIEDAKDLCPTNPRLPGGLSDLDVMGAETPGREAP